MSIFDFDEVVYMQTVRECANWIQVTMNPKPDSS